MLGTVLTHLRQKVTSLKDQLSAMGSTWIQRLKQYGVLPINQAIQSVKTTVLAAIKQNKDQLLVQIQTLLVSLMKVVSILVVLTLGVIGLLVQIIVWLYHRLVLSLSKKEQ